MSSIVARSQFRWPKFRHLLLPPAVLPLKSAICLLGVSLLYALNGAHNTEHLDFVHRLSLWSVVFSLTSFQFLGLAAILNRPGLSLVSNRWFRIGSSILITCAFLTLELHALKFTPFLPKDPDPFLEFYLFLLPTVSVWCCLLVLLELPTTPTCQTAREESRSGTAIGKNSLQHLLAQEQVLHVAACDHYLEVNCVSNRYLVRGKLKEAVALLQNEDGMQVHRSHWVAAKAIATSTREGRDLKLILTTGRKVSVSRTKVSMLNQLLSDSK